MRQLSDLSELEIEAIRNLPRRFTNEAAAKALGVTKGTVRRLRLGRFGQKVKPLKKHDHDLVSHMKSVSLGSRDLLRAILRTGKTHSPLTAEQIAIAQELAA